MSEIDYLQSDNDKAAEPERKELETEELEREELETEKLEIEDSEREELERAVNSLKATLKKQQKSYGKLHNLTKCFSDALLSMEDRDEAFMRRFKFSEEVFLTFLRMQTTGLYDVEKFSEDVKKDLLELSKENGGVKTGQVKSCLLKGQSRAKAQNIRFAIYLIAKTYAHCFRSFTIDVDSHYITTKDAEFFVTLSFPDNINKNIFEIEAEYFDYLTEMLEEISNDVRTVDDEAKVTYCITFSLER